MINPGHRFEFVEESYEGNIPAISCDGLVPGSQLDLTHWQGNRTPARYKADTSTEIAWHSASERLLVRSWPDAFSPGRNVIFWRLSKTAACSISVTSGLDMRGPTRLCGRFCRRRMAVRWLGRWDQSGGARVFRDDRYLWHRASGG